MKNGNSHRFQKMQGLFLLLNFMLIWGSGVFFAGNSFGGNKIHVEKRVKELDRLHEQILEKVSPLPAEGTIEVTAEVLKTNDGKRIRIVEKHISIPEGNVKAEKDEFSKN